MKRLIIYLLLVLPALVWAHGGEDHGSAGQGPHVQESAFFSSAAISDKYEMLLKYTPFEAKTGVSLQLYLSDYRTNRAIDDASLKVVSAEDKALQFTVRHLESGLYEIGGSFPEEKPYTLNVSVNSANGPDFMVLQNIRVGKELTSIAAGNTSFPLSTLIGVLFAGAGIGGLLAVVVFRRRTRKLQPKYLAAALVLLSMPLSTSRISAHGGHTESAQTVSSEQVMVPKATQFLYDIQTAVAEVRPLSASIEFPGTVIPSSNGHAVVQSPQTGTIISLNTEVGQHVSKGQVLAVIEQAVDAGTQIDLISKRNAAEAEYRAAKAQYDRLKSIQDIASKREVQEAETQYRIAKSDLELLRQLGSKNKGNKKLFTLVAPISGQVGTFTYAAGAVVNAGETLLTITNLSKVLIDAQIDPEISTAIADMDSFEAVRASDGSVIARLKLFSEGVAVHAENQSQEYLFQSVGTNPQIRIGERILVRATSDKATPMTIVPNSAVCEVNGRPAVFIKNGPEDYRVRYIRTGNQNGSHSGVLTGIQEGERVVVTGAYQMKSIFLNQ